MHLSNDDWGINLQYTKLLKEINRFRSIFRLIWSSLSKLKLMTTRSNDSSMKSILCIRYTKHKIHMLSYRLCTLCVCCPKWSMNIKSKENAQNQSGRMNWITATASMSTSECKHEWINQSQWAVKQANGYATHNQIDFNYLHMICV